MRLKGKILSLILVLILCITSVLPAFAENATVYFNADVEETIDRVGNNKISGFSYTRNEGTSDGRIIELEGGNKAFLLECLSGKGNFRLYKQLSEAATGDIVLEMDVRVTDHIASYKDVSVQGTNDVWIELCRISGDSLLLYNGTRICGLATDKFYRLSIAMHFDKGTMDIYFNGRHMVEGAALQNTTVTGTDRIRWEHRTAPEYSGWIVDNLRMYSSAVPLTDAELNKGVPLIFEEEIKETATEEEITAVTQKAVCMFLGKPSALVNGVKKYITEDKGVYPQELDSAVMIPVRFFAESVGAQLTTGADNTLTVTYKDKSVVMTFGDTQMSVGGSVTQMQAPLTNISGTGYAPCSDLCSALGINLFLDGGLIICSEEALSLNWTENSRLLSGICEKFVYEDASGEEMITALKAKNPGNSHPRLLMTADKFAYIKAELAKGDACDPTVKTLYDTMKKNADSTLSTLLYRYRGTKEETPFIKGRDVTKQIIAHAFMYNVTGEEKYGVRARQCLVNICAYGDWHPFRFIDTGKLTITAALGYDWMYDFLKQSDREFIKNAIVKKGLQQIINDYDGLTSIGTNKADPLMRNYLWNSALPITNWRFGAGGGVAIGALAVADELSETESETAERVLEEAIKGIQPAIALLAPDGVPAKQSTNVFYAVYIGSLITALGTDYGYANVPGIETSDAYMMINDVINSQLLLKLGGDDWCESAE